MARREEVDRFYQLMDRLEENVGGKRRLDDCTGYMDWPELGVYFFFAEDKYRDSGDQLRITRIGTHAVHADSDQELWDRLRAHRGNNRGTFAGGGNHRGSVFRLRIGEAMIEREGWERYFPKWGDGSSEDREIRLKEHPMEMRVSDYIRDLPFLWVSVDDDPGSDGDHMYIEKNTIALLSNYQREAIDSRSRDWLGSYSPSEAIRNSGLWNVDHVEADYDSSLLNLLDDAVKETDPP